MASSGSDAGRHLLQQAHHHHHHPEPAPEPAVREAQRWIEVRDVIALHYLEIQCICIMRTHAEALQHLCQV